MKRTKRQKPKRGLLLPCFKEGDRVRFEIRHNGSPRWNLFGDRGGCGQFVTGTITAHYDTSQVITRWYSRAGYLEYWIWPLPISLNFPDNPLHLDGWLELVE